jgi:hypothetical protein
MDTLSCCGSFFSMYRFFAKQSTSLCFTKELQSFTLSRPDCLPNTSLGDCATTQCELHNIHVLVTLSLLANGCS